MKKERVAYLFVAALFLLLCGFYFITSRQQQNSGLLTNEELSGETETKTPETILIHITGAVNNPGVLEMPAGSRLIDAVELAGGLKPEADTDSLNLAAVLEDEAKIVVYAKAAQTGTENVGGEAVAPPPANDKVNINTATVEELKRLSGIGDVIAQNIVDYRTEHGNFKSLEEIKKVNRIGDKLFESIKDNITLCLYKKHIAFSAIIVRID